MVHADSARTTDNWRPMVAAHVKDVCHQMSTVVAGHSFRLMTLVDASASGVRADGVLRRMATVVVGHSHRRMATLVDASESGVRADGVLRRMATVVAGHSHRRMATLVDASASGIRANGMNLHTFLHSPYGLRDVLAQPHWERTHSGNTPRDVTHPPSYVLAQPQ